MLHLTPAPIEKAAGTSLKGFLYADYTKMVMAFGMPHDDVNNEWVFKTPGGNIMTIYPSDENVIPKYETIWHVGGDKSVVYASALTALIQSEIERKP